MYLHLPLCTYTYNKTFTLNQVILPDKKSALNKRSMLYVCHIINTYLKLLPSTKIICN